jgi:uncharacterized protein (TIGR02453 family)
MPDGFVELIDTSNAFFADLAQNNTRSWFEPRKAQYIAEIRKPAELLGEILAEDIAHLTGKPHDPKLFRIYRDVRFSKDKTPYNAHLHLMWSRGAATAPVWFFGSAPDYLTVGMGLVGLQGPALARFRTFIDSRGDALKAAMDGAAQSAGAAISDWGPAPLKNVPKPYDPDHPHADLLKRKALAISAPLAAGWRETGVVPAVQSTLKALFPVWRLIDAEFS